MEKKAKSRKSDQALQKLSLSIGNFIRYWGFRRIHGAIWTQLYLSNTPMNCTDLTLRLGLSKALISPALEELCKHGLISEAPAPNEKTKLYQANEDINEVIRNVLKTRELKMMKQITKDFDAFKNCESKPPEVNIKRLGSLEEMILAANLVLEIMIEKKSLTHLPGEIDR